MADLGFDGGFDAQSVEPSQFDALPAGEYEACIVESEMKTTTAGTGKYLKLKLQVLSGPAQNRVLFDNLNLFNQSEKATQIARGTLSALCRAVGVLTPKDSSELHNKPLLVKIVVEKSEEYGEQNRVKAYKPRHVQPQTAPTPAAPRSVVAGAANALPWGA